MTTRTDDANPPSMKPFFLLWSGQAVSLLGSQVAQFALIWWLTLETGSAKILATATMFGLLPQVLLGPIAGAVIDRFSRHRILLVADAAIAFVSLILAALFWAGAAATWHVLAVLLIRAVASAFHQPTMMASTSMMVPKAHLARIQGLNESLEGLMLILAAPLGALALGALPIAAILGLDVVTAACAIAPLFTIRVPQPERSGGERDRTTVLSDVAAGFAYLRSWPGLLVLVAMGAMVNLFTTPASALLPILVKEHFGGSALELAWLASAFGLGLIAGGITLGAWGGFRRRVVTSLCGLFGLGSALLVIGLAPSSMYVVALVAMFAVGFMVSMANGPMQAAMQAVVAPEYQGRVFTLLQTLALVAAPTGLLIAGPVADAVGVQVWFLAAAAACFVKVLVGFGLPMVLYLEDGRCREAQTQRRGDEVEGTMPPSVNEPLEET